KAQGLRDCPTGTGCSRADSGAPDRGDSSRGLPLLRLEQHRAEKRVRVDRLQSHPLLSPLPSAVRRVQSSLGQPSISFTHRVKNAFAWKPSNTRWSMVRVT